MSEQEIPNTPALTGTAANVAMEVGDAAAARAQATVMVAAIQQRDAWITAAEQDLAERDSILSGLERHPTLWLILGREGIDRPGSVWSTTTGQQVVTRTRIAYRVVGLVALLMLLVGLGVGWGVGTGWDVSGMVDLINDMR
jgi:hypothetical protein